MTRWPRPSVTSLPGSGSTVRVFDSASAQLQPAGNSSEVGMYVCGITPYDATHLGHAATYVAFDLLHRALLDAGHEVRYVQNVTDVDDPLLERAAQTGVDWQDLAREQGDLFARDMAQLRVIPPHAYLGVVESLDLVADLVVRLREADLAYPVKGGAGEPDGDLYLDIRRDPRFGAVSHLSPEQMHPVFAERGGDPDRPGKRSPLDPLLWRLARPGEPSWEAAGLPAGRPGWHVECTAIALEHLGMGFAIQGGGSDLIFPHHEMGASHGQLLTGEYPYAKLYAHAGMVGYQGHKMSKSLGNLVLVSKLLEQGHHPATIRLALLAHHYRSDWEWTPSDLEQAQARHERWSAAFCAPRGPSATPLLGAVRAALAEDLDAPAALHAIDTWAATEGDDPEGPPLARQLADTLLGIDL